MCSAPRSGEFVAPSQTLYGEWPPRQRGDHQPMMKFPKPRDETWLTIILVALLVAGLILIVLPLVGQWTWDYGISHEVGVALTIAALLGLTVDYSLRHQLMGDVV